ncbi:hypothetical protein ATN88_07930 [Enterovibrio coralii]|uniref:Uncharacterized protein n=1 Tax=Enterovibrio coralii TaxID=294935 RepID=A0A135I5I9_9GAMM|nr:hypothetical protein ATN88_07930 [Enterovibrio coralii]
MVFLGDDEQAGYALAAEEPRVRFRHCQSLSAKEIATEFLWSERCISKVHGIVVMVPFSQSVLLSEEYYQSLLAEIGSPITDAESPLTLTYVVFPEKDSEADNLKSLHLSLCQRSHDVKNADSTLRINHVFVSDSAVYSSEDCGNLAADTSELIHYLTSTTSHCLHSQAFYFGNV